MSSKIAIYQSIPPVTEVLVVAPRLRNLPTVQVCSRKMAPFEFRCIQNPIQRFLAGQTCTIGCQPAVVAGLTWPVGSNLRFTFPGFTIYGCSQICYWYVQNITFGTSFSLFVLLAVLIIKTWRDLLPATSLSWVWMIFLLVSVVRFGVQNSHIES